MKIYNHYEILTQHSNSLSNKLHKDHSVPSSVRRGKQRHKHPIRVPSFTVSHSHKIN